MIKYKKQLDKKIFEIKTVKEIRKCDSKNCIFEANTYIIFDFRKEPIYLCFSCLEKLGNFKRGWKKPKYRQMELNKWQKKNQKMK